MCDNNFQQLYERLCRDLTDSSRAKQSTDSFAALRSNSERAKFAYDLLEEFQLFPRVAVEFKSEIASCMYREQGNSLFKAKEDGEAMRMYTKSIAYAPKGAECLGLAFANRSAVLFEKKLYKECLSDIENAFKDSYPRNLSQKLEKRREKAVSLAFQQLTIAYHTDIPKLLKPHPYISCASEAVEINNTPEMGRHVVASRDISVGEVIAIEKPYTKILLKEKCLDHCHNCLKLCYNLLPCDECTEAMFCGENCKTSAWSSYHQYECPIIAILYKMGCSKMTHIAIRITLVARNVYSTIKNITNSDIYRSERYEEIHQLIANTDKRSVTDLFKRAVTVAIIYYLIQLKTSFFVDLNVDGAQEIFLELLLLHMQTGPSNFHEISEFILSSDGCYEPDEIGAGAYAFLSLLNHSCCPNVVRHCYGTTIVLRALRPVKRGEQLFDNYGYHHALMSKSERQGQLLEQYYFKCRCQACEEDWPLYHDLRTVKCDTKMDEAVLIALRRGDMEVAKATLQIAVVEASRLEKFAPCKELANFQEIMKQCYGVFGNKRVLS